MLLSAMPRPPCTIVTIFVPAPPVAPRAELSCNCNCLALALPAPPRAAEEEEEEEEEAGPFASTALLPAEFLRRASPSLPLPTLVLPLPPAAPLVPTRLFLLLRRPSSSSSSSLDKARTAAAAAAAAVADAPRTRLPEAEPSLLLPPLLTLTPRDPLVDCLAKESVEGDDAPSKRKMRRRSRVCMRK